MPKGRKKIDPQLKILRGTDQPCRMVAPAVAFSQPNKLPNVTQFKLSKLAKIIFRDAARDLVACRILDSVSVPMLAAYAKEMATYFELMVDVEKEGYTIERETKFGAITVANPKRASASAALAAAKSIASDFGFTPATKARIAALVVGKPEKENEFTQFTEL